MDSANEKEFNISLNCGHLDVFKLLISWARFVTFEGDPKELTDANNQACSDEPTLYHLD